MRIDFDEFHLRPLVEGDSKGFHDLVRRNAPRLSFLTSTLRRTKTKKSTEEYVQYLVEKKAKRESLPLVLVHTPTSQLIGFMILFNIDWDVKKGEFGSFIDKDTEGQGYISQAIGGLLTHSFKELGFNKVFTRAHPDNKGANRIACKLGFKHEGTIRSDYLTAKGEVVDLNYYGILTNEWITDKP